jgi:hypothetical protein
MQVPEGLRQAGRFPTSGKIGQKWGTPAVGVEGRSLRLLDGRGARPYMSDVRSGRWVLPDELC